MAIHVCNVFKSYCILNCFYFSGLLWSDQYKHEGIEYALSESQANWFDARDSCHEDNATLAVIATPDQDVFLRQICPNHGQT